MWGNNYCYKRKCCWYFICHSEYLAYIATGHGPKIGINPSIVCFSLQYEDSNINFYSKLGESNESLLQVEAILKENDVYIIKKFVALKWIWYKVITKFSKLLSNWCLYGHYL